MQSVVTVVVFLLLARSAYSQCLPDATSDTLVPVNPNITALVPSIPNTAYVPPGCSERVEMPNMGEYKLANWTWPRINCPHKVAGLVPLSTHVPGITAGSNVVITTNVLVRQCDLPAGGAIINRITVNAGASLVFDDSEIWMNVREIWVKSGASILAGSEQCRRFSKLKITFHGTRSDSATEFTGTGATTKGLVSEGITEFHGKQYHPTWTRLATHANIGSRYIVLQDAVNWEVGQEVVITTTTLWDCPDKYKDPWCKPCPDWDTCTPHNHQNEIRRISGIYLDVVTPRYILQLNSSLTYKHYAGREYQGEVALLDRRIVFEGAPAPNGFGGHTMVMGTSGEARFSGCMGVNLGQLNIVGRYPFHMHLMGDSAKTYASYFQDCSVTNSNFRAYTIHGTNQTRVSRNVAYNVEGFAFYLEDGVEERNLLEYNFAAHIHPIKRPADGGSGQGGETFDQAADLFLPADVSASGFYFPNAYNYIIGNAASGGWSGFAFPTVKERLGSFRGTMVLGAMTQPWRRPLLKFYGNTAHSSGFYWDGSGSCVYTGADINFNGPSGVIRYQSGRVARGTYLPSDRPMLDTMRHMLFEHTKTWQCNKGISHWGEASIVTGFEAHDIRTAAMLFGEAALDNALITGRTPNHPTHLTLLDDSKMGFQFYDTWTKTLMTNVTFRNFSRLLGTGQKDWAIRYMDHSDQFTPQGINSVKGLVWEDVPENTRLGVANCGTACGDRLTMSSKMYSVWDWDGSFTQRGKPTVMGGNPGWWNWDNSCSYKTEFKVWVCDWHNKRTVGYIQLWTPLLYDGGDYNIYPSCTAGGTLPNCITGHYVPYTVGHVVQWARGGDVANYGITLSPWTGVTGFTQTGWHWRVNAPNYNINGAPTLFRVGDGNTGRNLYYQLPKGQFIVLTVAYPPQTKFAVRFWSTWGMAYPNLTMSTLDTVLTPTENIKPNSQMTCPGGGAWYERCSDTGGIGPAWHFDGTHLYLRVVNPQCYIRDADTRTSCEDFRAYFAHGGVKVPGLLRGIGIEVKVTQCTGCTYLAGTPGGIQYIDHPDTGGPSTPFPNPDWGTAPAAPLPQPKARGEFQPHTKCAPARGQSPAPPTPVQPPGNPGSSSSSSSSSSTGTHSSTISSSSTGVRSSSSSSTGTRSSSSSTGTRSSSSGANVPRSSSSSSSSTGNSNPNNTQPLTPDPNNPTPPSDPGGDPDGLLGMEWAMAGPIIGAIGGVFLLGTGVAVWRCKKRRVNKGSPSGSSANLVGTHAEMTSSSSPTSRPSNFAGVTVGSSLGSSADESSNGGYAPRPSSPRGPPPDMPARPSSPRPPPPRRSNAY